MQTGTAQKSHSTDLTIARVFSAPREKVFKAWTKSRHIIHWWTPAGFTMTAHKMDIHTGGLFRCTLRRPDGTEIEAQGVYREMVEPSHIAFTHSWCENGNRTPETMVTVELTEDNGKTNAVFYQSGFTSDDERESHEKGWSECFDLLDRYLATEKEPF